MPASWLQSVPPICVILLSPVFAWSGSSPGSRSRRCRRSSACGLVLLAIGFFVMVVAASQTAGGADRVGPGWLVLTYFIHTVGELCLSPVGLSSVTKLAPRRLVGQMMGTFFMGNALGNLIAGLTAGSFSSMPLPVLFGTIAKVTGVAGLLLLVFSAADTPVDRRSADRAGVQLGFGEVGSPGLDLGLATAEKGRNSSRAAAVLDDLERAND